MTTVADKRDGPIAVVINERSALTAPEAGGYMDAEAPVMAGTLLRRRFSRAEYYKMAEAGILAPTERVELINGEIIELSPIGNRHAAAVRRLNAFFHHILLDQALVDVQNPVVIDDLSEPQPDVTILKPRADFYADGHPTPQDVLLLVEVSDTSASYDRRIKAPLYAAAGIMEYWLIDLRARAVEIYRDPAREAYASVLTLNVNDTDMERRYLRLVFAQPEFRAEDCYSIGKVFGAN